MLAILGTVVSVLSTLDHLEYVAPLSDGSTFCAAVAASGCTSAHASPSSEVFGIPITLYGLGFYVAVLVLTGWAAFRGRATGVGRTGGSAQWAPVAVSALSVLSVLYSLYLASVLYRRGAVCPFCLVLYGVNLGLVGVATAWAGPAWRHAGAALRASVRALGLAAIVGGLTLAMTATMYFLARAGREASTRPVTSGLPSGRLALPDRIPTHGPPGATSELVVFADFECPACARLHATVNQVVRKLGKDAPRVRFVNFPLDTQCNPYSTRRVHESACLDARGALCAAREGVFWEYAGIRFSSPGRHEQEDVVNTAKAIGLDAEAFSACMDAPETGRLLAEDIELARAAGVTATPTYLLDGQKYVGATTPAALERMLRVDAR
jgi:protein-disulfide isomerase